MTKDLVKHFVYDHELSLYPYAPLGILHNEGKWPEPKYQFSIVSCITTKDSNTIIEWLNYHQKIGINHIYLYCTDDDPVELYRKVLPFTLGKSPFVTFYHYRFKEIKRRIIFHFFRNHLHETRWHITLDVADFIYVHKATSLDKFVHDFGAIDVIYFNIVFYTHPETAPVQTQSTLLTYTNRAPQASVFTRVMIRSSAFPYQEAFKHLSLDTHNDLTYLSPQTTTINTLHQDMTTYYNHFPDSALTFRHTNERWNTITQYAYIARYPSNTPSKMVPPPFTADLSTQEKNKYGYTDKVQQDLNLQKYWSKTLGKSWEHSVIPITNGLLLSTNCPCCQSSSASKTRTPDQIARNLVTNVLKGITQSCTLAEANPWWEVDLQTLQTIKEIWIFNGLDIYMTNMTNFIIESSSNHDLWTLRHERKDKGLLGGADGNLFAWKHPLGFMARWIRITIPGEHETLSLDQVQIFGIPHPPSL